MTNSEIARHLVQLAEAIEQSGAPDASFRARALRNGAQAIEALRDSAEERYQAGTLEVRGVGEGIRRRVGELVATGGLAEIAELRRQAAPWVSFLVVEGLGPRTAQLIHDKLGISTLDELEAAARAGRLHDLPRLGKKKEAQILAAIPRARQATGRIRLDRAERDAQPLLARLREAPGVLRLEVAGSLRRRRETVADVDVLVSTRDAGPVMDVLVGSAQVAAVLARGPTKASVKIGTGLQVDLRCVPPESFGAALHYFTGSKEHNVAVRTLGVKRGLKINEYGVFDVSAGEEHARRIGGADEEEVFAAVGLPWIPPELRENQGEIEAAAGHALPHLVELRHLRGDLHLHTTETDGRASLEEMVTAALALGHEYVAITDHSQALGMVRGLDPPRLRAQGEAIRALEARLEGRIRILRGVEADVLEDGAIDLGDSGVLEELDWVIGSVHSQFGLPRAAQTARIVRALESGQIDALGHPTGRLLEQRPPYDVDMEAIVAAAARTGVALELDGYPERLDLCDVHCRMAREAGAFVVIDSDAHAAGHLGGLASGIDQARRGWLEPRHVLNTRPVDALLEHSRRHRPRRHARH